MALEYLHDVGEDLFLLWQDPTLWDVPSTLIVRLRVDQIRADPRVLLAGERDERVSERSGIL